MTVGGALILYATAVGLAGAAGFRRAVWPLRAPRLGAAVVLAAAWSVPVAFVLAGVTIILPPSALFTDLGQLAGACLDRLRAAYGTPAGAGIVTAGQVLSLALLARLVWAVTTVARRRRTQRRRHRLLLRLAGGHRPDVAAVVLDCPGPAAYSVGGRRPAVVVTSGAVELLTGPQLGAAVQVHRRPQRRQALAQGDGAGGEAAQYLRVRRPRADPVHPPLRPDRRQGRELEDPERRPPEPGQVPEVGLGGDEPTDGAGPAQGVPPLRRRHAQRVALLDRPAEQVDERRVDGRVRDPARRQQQLHGASQDVAGSRGVAVDRARRGNSSTLGGPRHRPQRRPWLAVTDGGRRAPGPGGRGARRVGVCTRVRSRT